MEGIWKARRHSALSHDGVDDYEEVADSASLDITDAIAIEAWVKPLSIRIYEIFVLKGVSANNYVYTSRFQGGGKAEAVIRIGGSYFSIVGNSVWVPGKWYHAVFTYNSLQMRWFLNGVEDASPVSQTGNIDSVAQSLKVGGDGIGNYFFNGLIASVRIYNRALSEAEIKYLYYNPDDPLDTDHLVLWLHPGSIDTDAGYWWDLSGRDNHGQIFGATKVSLVSPEVTVL